MDMKFRGTNRLDFIIEKGIPQDSSLLFSGPPSCGKSTLVKQMILETLLSGGRCVYVASEEEMNALRQKKRMLSQDIKDFLKEEMLSPVSISEQTRLKEMGVKISDASVRQNPTLIVIDSLTQASVGIDHETVLRAVEFLCRKADSLRSDIFFVWTPTASTEDLTMRLETIVDGVIEFRIEGEEVERSLRVYKMEGRSHDTKWHHFTIDGNGLNFGRQEEDKTREELLSSLGIAEPDEGFIKGILEREELSHLLGKEHKPPKRKSAEEIMLEVKKARNIDVEKDHARINKEVRERLGVDEGDAIIVTGKNSIRCEVKVAWREDAGKDIIRLNKRLRDRLGVEDSDKVLVRRA